MATYEKVKNVVLGVTAVTAVVASAYAATNLYNKERDYSDILVESAKKYVENNNLAIESQLVTSASRLKESGNLVGDLKDDCINESYVTVTNEDGTYKYEPSLVCKTEEGTNNSTIAANKELTYTVKTSSTTLTNANVEVQVIFSEEIHNVSVQGWTLSSDKKVLTKIFTENSTDEFQAVSLDGYRSVNVKVSASNIDKEAPVVLIDDKEVVAMYAAGVKLNVDDANLSSVKVNGEEVTNYSISSDGNYEVVATDVAGNKTVKTFSLGREAANPPKINNITDGKVYTENNLPLRVTFSGSEATLYGPGTEEKTFISGGFIRQAGKYALTVKNSVGESLTVNFTIDDDVPEVWAEADGNTLQNGKSTNKNVKVYFSDKYTNVTVKSSSKYNNLKYGEEFTKEGSYVITATDEAGHTKEFRFTIDRSIPVVNGVIDGKYYSSNRTIVFDNKGGTVTAKLDNKEISSGHTVTDEGKHTLVVSSTAGNSNVINFWIDKTKPEFEGFSTTQDTVITKNNFEVKASDTNLQSVQVKKGDEVVATSETTLKDEGVYTLIATDKAGNTTTKTVKIDKTAPAVTVGGNAPIIGVGAIDKAFEGDVTFTVSDMSSTTVKVDGKAFTGNTVTANGRHSLEVTDAVGNKSIIYFTIAKDVPEVKLISNGNEIIADNEMLTHYFNKDVTIKISNNVEIKSAILTTPDGDVTLTASEIANGKTINANYGFHKEYKLVVIDSAERNITVNFVIDRKRPTSSVVSEVYSTDKLIEFSDMSGIVSATLDGKAIESGKVTLSEEGEHTLVLTDKAGNSVSYSPIIDKSAPKVTIDGKLFTASELTNTIYFNKEVTVSLEDTYSSINVSVNGETRKVSVTSPKRYTEILSANGEYAFIVTDGVGHTARFTVVINTKKPVGAITKENVYDETIENRINAVKMTLTLDENYTISDSNDLDWKLVEPSAVAGKVQYTYTLTDTLSGAVTLTNNVGNSINVPYDVVIDKTAPTASIEYSTTAPISGNVEIYMYTNEPVKFTDSLAWSEGQLITEGKHKGEYKYVAIAVENVEKILELFDGNQNKTPIKYSVKNIDKNVDLIGYKNEEDETIIEYFTYSNNGAATNQPVTVTLKAYEKLTFSDTVLTWTESGPTKDENGKDVYTYTATADDNYTNTLKVTDALNNEETITYKVTGIDTEGPKVGGFDEDHYNENTKSYLFNTNVTPTFTEGTAVLKKKNAKGEYVTYIKEFTSGTEIGGTELIDETYRLEVSDGINTTTIDFRIDKVIPTATYTLSKTESNKTIATITASEYITVTANATEVIYLDGHEGFTYTFNDPEVITFRFKDEAGNVGSIDVDAIAPEIEGIENNGKYATTDKVITITDNKLGVSATLDGTAITGTEVENGFSFNISSILGTTGNGETHTLVVRDVAGNIITYTFTIDTESPIITGIENEGLYNNTVNPRFTEGTATLERKYTELVSGELVEKTETIDNFESGANVSADGKYTLTVTDGITKPTVYTFEIDKTAPTIISSGIETSNGKAYTNEYVIVTLNASEPIDMTSTHELIEVSADKKTYKFKVSANGEVTFSFKDKANNTGDKTVNVQQIDNTPPTISGVTDKELYNADEVPLTITFFDENGDETVTLTRKFVINGEENTETINNFVSGNKISDEGTYTLEVTDIAGNGTTYTFEVDKTAPDVTLPTGGTTVDGKLLYNKDVKPLYSEGTGVLKKKVVDDQGVESYVDVTTYDKEVAISENGEYRLIVSDLAGNETIKEFTIDKASPNVKSIKADITAPTNENVTLTITLDKPVTMDTSYSTVSADRKTYTVTVTENKTVSFQFHDDAGNANNATFTVNNIDRKMKHGEITADEAPTKGPVTLTLTVDEPIKNIDTTLWTKVETTEDNSSNENLTNSTPVPDQTPVSYTRVVKANGEYTVTYTDMAGNEGSASITINNIDTGAPTFEIVDSVSLPEYSDIYKDTVKVKVKDQNLKAITYTLNGEEQEPVDLKDYANGEITVSFSKDGVYVINAIDDFDQPAQPITFTVDKEIPTIIVKANGNICPGGIVYGTAIVEVTDTTLNSVSYIETIGSNSTTKTVKVVNGKGTISLGAEGETEATYEIIATDKANHTNRMSFGIDTKKPEINGFENNKKYKDSVTVNVIDANLKEVTYTGPTESQSGTLEGEHTFEEAGTYTIVAKDYANNTATKTFTIDKTTPKLLSIKSKYMADGQKYTNMANDILILTFNKPVKLDTTSSSWVDENGVTLTEEARQKYSDTLYFAISVNFTLSTTFSDEVDNTEDILYEIKQFYRETPVINVGDVIIVNKKNVNTFELPEVTGSTTNSEIHVTVTTEDTFDPDQLEQVITYNATDDAGNTASKDVTVRIIDTRALDTIKLELSALRESDYTEDSWTNKNKLITDLESAIAGTNENVDLKDVTQSFVDSKITEIRNYNLVAKGLNTDEFEDLQDIVGDLVKSDYVPSDELETLWSEIDNLAKTDTSTIEQLQSNLDAIVTNLRAKLTELEGKAAPIVKKNQEYIDSFKDGDYSNKETFISKLGELNGKVDNKTIKLQSKYNKEVETLEATLIKKLVIDTDLVKAESDFAKLVLTDYTTTSYNRLKAALEAARESVTNPGLISVYIEKMTSVVSAQNALEIIPRLMEEPTLTTSNTNSDYAKLGDTLTLEFESNVELNLELSETNRFATVVTINGKTAAISKKENTAPGKYVYVATVTVEDTDQERYAPYTIVLASKQQITGTTVGKTSNILVDRTPAEATLTAKPSGQTKGPVTLTLSSSEEIKITRTAKKVYSDDNKATIIDTNEVWTSVGTEGKEYTLDIAENRIVVVYYTDKAGNLASEEIEITNIDTAAPTIEIDANYKTATKEDVVLTIVASEPLKSMIIDGTLVTGTDNTYTYTVTEPKIVTIQFEDYAGYEITENYDATYIDKTPATIEKPIYEINGNSTKITVTSSEKITFKDQVTLVDENGLEWEETPVGDGTYKYVATTDGNYKATFTVLDHVGNESTFSYDVTKPELLSIRSKVMNCNLLEGIRYTNAKKDILILKFNRPVKLNTSSPSWVKDEAGSILSAEERQQYSEILYFAINVNFGFNTTFTDELGRTGRISYKIEQFDRQAPQFTSDIDTLYGQDITLTVDFSDVDVATDGTVTNNDHEVTAELLKENDDAITIGKGYTIKYKKTADVTAEQNEVLLEESGVYTIRLTDAAGNVTEKKFELDVTGPTIEITPNSTKDDGTYIGPVNITVTDKNGLGDDVHIEVVGKEEPITIENGKATITDGGTYKVVATDSLGNTTETQEFTVAEPPKIVSIRSKVMDCELLEGQQYTNAKRDTLILTFNRPVVLKTQSASLVDEDGNKLEDRTTPRETYYFQININFDLSINLEDTDGQTGRLYYKIRQFDRGEPKFTSEIKSLYGKGINLPVTFTDEDLSTDYLNDKIVSDDNHTITAELLDEDEKVITTIKNGDVIKYKAEADTEAQEGEILVTAGKYTIKLTDKAGNTASKEFEVVDNGPEITLPESVVTGKKIYDSAITPEYEGTGVLEKKINGEYTEVTYTKGTPIPSGEYKLTVTDKVGNSNFETFKIYAEVPTFETFDARKVTVKGTPLTITDPTATDALGNTLTPVITDVTYNGTSLGADGTVDYSEAGTYVITYTATDEALNPETATMTIEVLDIDAFNSIKTAMDDLEGNMKDAEGNVIPFYERVKVNKDDYTEASWNARMAKIAEVNAELAKDEITIDQAYIETIVALLNNTAEDNAGEAYKLVSNGVSFTAYDNLVTEFNGLNGVDYDKTKIQGIIDKFDKESVSADELQSTFNRETYLPLKTKVESLKNNPKEITLISEDEKAAISANVDYTESGKEVFFEGLDTLATQVADKTIKLQSEYNAKVSELKTALENNPAHITDAMIEELTAIENKYQGKEADYTSGTFQTLQTAIANAKELLPNGKVSDFNTALDNIELAEQGLVKVLTATDVKINGESVTELVTRYAKSGDTLTLTFNTNHDINTASSIVTIDGVTANLSGSNKSYTATVTISDEVVADHKAEYTIVLVAEKAERKEYSNVQTNIIVDKTAPRKLDLTYTTGTVVTTDNGDKYVKNEATLLEGYKTNKNVIVKIKTNEELSAITGDGHNWFEIMAEPEIDLDDVESYYYRLEISENTNGPVSIKLKDMAGNESEVITYSVDGIDRSIPTADITPSKTELTNQDIVLTLTPSEELKTISEEWTKQSDGTYTMPVSTVGTYTATFTDMAGNPGSASITVNNIDKVKPNVSVSYGAYTGGWSKNDVTVTITSDKQLAVLTDGESDWTTSEKGTEDAEGNITAPYTYSKTFSSYAGGETSLTIEDKAGNEPKEKVKFSIDGIDKNPPSLKVNANGNLYPGGLIHGRVTVTAEDDHLKSLTYIETIDGVSTTKYVTVTNGVASIELGTDDETEARYEFTATDEATNSTSFAFAVDTKKPVITGVTNGETYENSVTATVTDANIKEVTYRGPESGTFEGTTHEFTVDGTYTVTATDYANNTTTVEFTIDQTLPEVTGVEDGGKYNSIPTITFDKGTATLNGTPFTSGSTVGEGKNQTLVVTSPAGTTTITFTVDTVVPNITSIKDGKVYKGSVAINYDDATTIPTGMIGDKLVANGSTFSKEGTHTLVVTDETGNKAEVTFTIDNTAPILEITDNKGVKHTSDFEVTLEADKVNKFTNFEYTASDRAGVTVKVDITGTVELSKKGYYTLVYTATDDVGNETPITVTVHVIDSAPVITMGEDGKAIEVKYGSTFTDPYGATAEDAFDGVVEVKSTNNVNIYQVGTYKITYTAQDSSGNKSTKERTVKVVSTDTGELFRTANQCREGTQCYGSYASNNYVWYSGHLWRVIKVNPDNTLKLVAEDAASGFSFDDTSSVFAGSNAEKWLNNVFYPSLNNGDTIVTEGEFCNEKMTSLTNIRYTCSAGSVVKSKVGLLTIDEYNILGGQNGFLNNGLQYFTMTPTSEDTTWVVEDDGTKERGYYVTEPYAMRPVININAVTVLSGRGTETDPFVIDEGNKSSAGSKLTSSTSGEYVNFGGKKWRVVSSSNEGTKLITDDYVKLGSDYEGQAFGTAGVFNTSSGIGYYLNNTIYNGFTTTEKSLIKLSRWYNNQYTFGQNPMDTTLVAGSKYTDAYVGLIRVGELMSGSTTSTVKVDRFTYWTLNYSGTNSWFVSWGGTSEISSATNLRGIRPVITLAEDVVIASGDGTEAHPYELDINKN